MALHAVTPFPWNKQYKKEFTNKLDPDQTSRISASDSIQVVLLWVTESSQT